MAEGKFSALSNKIKEHAANTAQNDTPSDGKQKGLFGFGNKPNANSTSALKPTAAATSVKPIATKTSAFTDVPASAYYADAVAWAVQKGITSGTSDTTFSPDNPCHRGHVATFLWRMKGSPAPKNTNNSFTDVSDGPFYKAILWAVQNGIMEGKTAKTFEPTTPCTRGEVLTCLYRAEGKAKATEDEAVKWANVKRLMTGFSGGANAPCTRADLVTMLYRAKK